MGRSPGEQEGRTPRPTSQTPTPLLCLPGRVLGNTCLEQLSGEGGCKDPAMGFPQINNSLLSSAELLLAPCQGDKLIPLINYQPRWLVACPGGRWRGSPGLIGAVWVLPSCLWGLPRKPQQHPCPPGPAAPPRGPGTRAGTVSRGAPGALAGEGPITMKWGGSSPEKNFTRRKVMENLPEKQLFRKRSVHPSGKT